MTRLAAMCPNLTHLVLCWMYLLTEAGILSLVSLLRQIVQCNPQITVLNMRRFSSDNVENENIGELVLEILMSSNIDSITDLDFSQNSWFCHPDTEEERSGNVDLLVELITKQTGLQKINLEENEFSDAAKQKIQARIAAHPNTSLETKGL